MENKYCPECGQQLPEGALFCPACGKKINLENAVKNNQISNDSRQFSSKVGKKKKIVIASAVAAVIIIAVVIFLVVGTSGGKSKIEEEICGSWTQVDRIYDGDDWDWEGHNPWYDLNFYSDGTWDYDDDYTHEWTILNDGTLKLQYVNDPDEENSTEVWNISIDNDEMILSDEEYGIYLTYVRVGSDAEAEWEAKAEEETADEEDETEEDDTAVSYSNVSGTYGDIAWTLQGGVLTVRPADGVDSGDIYDFGPGNYYGHTSWQYAPWKDYASQITDIVIEDGITGIGDSLYDCVNAVTLVISETVASINSQSLACCSSLETIYYGGTETMWNYINDDVESLSFVDVIFEMEEDTSANGVSIDAEQFGLITDTEVLYYLIDDYDSDGYEEAVAFVVTYVIEGEGTGVSGYFISSENEVSVAAEDIWFSEGDSFTGEIVSEGDQKYAVFYIEGEAEGQVKIWIEDGEVECIYQ